MKDNLFEIFIGIDPGSIGGFSILTKEGGVKCAIELPFKKNKDLDWMKLSEELDSCNESTNYEIKYTCFIERPIYMPSQAVKSTATSWFNYGKLIMILEMFHISYQEIGPKEWKKEFNLIMPSLKLTKSQKEILSKKQKNALKTARKKEIKIKSVSTAEHLFPGITLYTPGGRMLDGIAEALLISEYARRKCVSRSSHD